MSQILPQKGVFPSGGIKNRKKVVSGQNMRHLRCSKAKPFDTYYKQYILNMTPYMG